MTEPTYDMFTAPKRDSFHWTPGNVTWSEIKSWMDTPALKKACGNYVLGTMVETTDVHKPSTVECTAFHRTKTSMRTRGVVTLDVDHPESTFLIDALLLPYRALIHTTYSSTPKEPRYRLLVPLDRSVAPDEYHVIASAIMQTLGEDQFDPGSVQAERYMFKPSESKRGYFHWEEITGDPASADELLSEFDPDLSKLPLPKPHKNKRDPFGLVGTIGAFNRAYEDFGTLISEYSLPYEEAGAERWHLAGAAAAAGMGVVAPGLVYSHHANDPAYGQTCSAFDLVRLHLYGALDENCSDTTPVNRLPSTKAMLEHATMDMRVVTELLGDDFVTEMETTADEVDHDPTVNWRMQFKLDPKQGTPLDDIDNWDLIVRHDPAFKVLEFNELSLALEITADLPWRKLEKNRAAFDTRDRSALALHIERQYHLRPGRGYLDNLLDSLAIKRQFNPVVDYLESLEWDGTKRVEFCLPGVKDSAFVRLAARKAMVAAVARMLDPGCKWDHMLVIYGPEGKGKSRWIDLMSRGYSVALGRLTDKDTLITMQRAWIMTSDEGYSMKKADFDAQKEFITRTHDIFRMPYDREAQVHPRHCVIWGTTNDETFLRNQEGNRRFHIVRSDQPTDFDMLTPEYVDQVWAEAVTLYRAGELMYLTPDEDELASRERVRYTEENALAGLIQEYLDTPVPVGYWDMSPDERQLWQMNSGDGFVTKGTEQLNRVCSIQVWVEALNRRRGEARRIDLIEIIDVMRDLPGWERRERKQTVPGYGPQNVFVRSGSPEAAEVVPVAATRRDPLAEAKADFALESLEDLL